MATTVPPAAVQSELRESPNPAEPLLEMGDVLSRGEFERRYERMRHLKKAELIDRSVFMPSPVRAKAHSFPHSLLSGWMLVYAADTPEVECGDNSSVRLDLDNEPQPDLVLLKSAAKGGQTRISADDYIEGAPELVVEIVGSSRAYDLHQKKSAYRRSGVREYLVWITDEKQVIWWELKDGDYHQIAPEQDGVLKSRVFPGLWLDPKALLAGDKKKVLSVLRKGLDSPQHQAFVSG